MRGIKMRKEKEEKEKQLTVAKNRYVVVFGSVLCKNSCCWD